MRRKKNVQSFLFKADNILSKNIILIKELSLESSEKMYPNLVGFQKKHEQLKKYWEAIILGILDDKYIKEESLKKSIEEAKKVKKGA